MSQEQSDTLDQLNDMNGGLGDALPQGTQEPTAPENDAALAEAAPEAEFFEVDGQKFADEKAAFDYLKNRNSELEADQMVAAARVEGMQEALRYAPQGIVPQNVQNQVANDPTLDAEAFYDDPVAYLAKERQKIKQEVMGEVTSQQTKAQREAQIWGEFTSSYPELADLRDVVDLVAEQHKETIQAIAARNPQKAYDFVATKVKTKMQNYVESVKPTRVLASTKGGASVGGNQPAAPTPNASNNNKPLDFISQIKQNRRV